MSMVTLWAYFFFVKIIDSIEPRKNPSGEENGYPVILACGWDKWWQFPVNGGAEPVTSRADSQ